MTSQALVTVIIPVFNRREELRRALASLCLQNFKKFKVLVCDDGSTDEPSRVVNEFASQLSVELRSQANSGLPASARNLGLRDLDTEFVAFLDSDDWWASEKLLRSVEALHSGSDFVYHDLYRAENGRAIRNIRRVRTRGLGKKVRKSLLARGNGIATSSVVFRASLVERVGLMSVETDVRAWEDYEYWLRIAEVTNKFKRLPSCLGYYSVDPASLSNEIGLLRSLGTIQSRYFQNSKRLPSWVHFGLGVALFRSGDYLACRKHLFKSLLVNGLPRIWIEILQAFALIALTFLPNSVRAQRRSR